MSIFGTVSAEGGFDQSEIDFVTQLISSGQTTIDEASNQFGVPIDVVASVYAQNAPKFASPAPVITAPVSAPTVTLTPTPVAAPVTNQDSLFNDLINITASVGDLYNSGASTPIVINNANSGAYQSPYALNAAESTGATNEQLADIAQRTNTVLESGGTALEGLKAYNAAETAGAASAASDVFAGGLGSVVAAVGGKESPEETAVLTVLSAFNPAAALAYRIFDAMDLFGGGGLKATSMTPEEAATYAAESRLASNLQGAGEGAAELIIDAVEQARAANVDPEDIAEALNESDNPVAGLINLTVGSNQMLSDADLAAAQATTTQTAAEEALSNISAEGGFSEAEANEVYDLLEAGTVNLKDVSTILNVPEAVVTAGYDQIKAERAAPEEIVDLTADTDLTGSAEQTAIDLEAEAAAAANAGLNDTTYTDANGVTWVSQGKHPVSGALIWQAQNPTAQDIADAIQNTGGYTSIEDGGQGVRVLTSEGEVPVAATSTTDGADLTDDTEETISTGSGVNITITGGGLADDVVNSIIYGPFQTQAEADAAVSKNGDGDKNGNGDGDKDGGDGGDKVVDPELTTPDPEPPIVDPEPPEPPQPEPPTPDPEPDPPQPEPTGRVIGDPFVATGKNGKDGQDGRDGKDGKDGKDGVIGLFSAIQDSPLTESLLFEPKFTELDNVQLGMFERFLRAAGGRR